MLILKLVIEILILWVWFALFMLALVGRKGPVGGIIFYPKVMQDRVIEMGLTTAKKIKQRTVSAGTYRGKVTVDDPASDRRSDISDSHDTLYKRRKRLFRMCVAVLRPVLRNGIFRLVLR